MARSNVILAAVACLLIAAGVHAQGVYNYSTWQAACQNRYVLFAPTAPPNISCSTYLQFNTSNNNLNVGASSTPGVVSVGTLDSMVVNGVTLAPLLALNSNIQGQIELHAYSGAGPTGGAQFYGVRSRGSLSSPAIVQNGDNLYTIYAAGYNGATYSQGGYLRFLVDGTPGASAMPSDAVIALSATGTQTPSTVQQWYADGGTVVGAATGGDKGAGSINAKSVYVNGTAVTTGCTTASTFTATLTGMTTTVTGPIEYETCDGGNIVILWAGANLTGTSNSTSLTMTGLPSSIWPNVGAGTCVSSNADNGSGVFSYWSISASGTITFYASTVSGTRVLFSSTGFTSSGTKGLFGGDACIYTVN